MENRAQHMATIMNISHKTAMNNIRAAGKRSRIIAGAFSDANEISMAGHRSRSASLDRSQGRLVNSIREVENYAIPGSTTAVQLPPGYDHVYSNGNGEYLLTNDAVLNPAADLGGYLDGDLDGGNWTALKPAGR